MEEEESKNEKSSKMRSGDKYVIRKLVSLKISPEDMQEYLNMLTSGTPSLPMMTPSYHTYLSIPSQPSHVRSNSQYNTHSHIQVNPANQYFIPDDSQIYQNHQINLVNMNPYFGSYGHNAVGMYNIPIGFNEQFNQMNFGEASSNASLENNLSLNNDPLSSVPLHLRKMRPIRSQSSTKIDRGSEYMQSSFLFDKIMDSPSKDDN